MRDLPARKDVESSANGVNARFIDWLLSRAVRVGSWTSPEPQMATVRLLLDQKANLENKLDIVLLVGRDIF